MNKSFGRLFYRILKNLKRVLDKVVPRLGLYIMLLFTDYLSVIKLDDIYYGDYYSERREWIQDIDKIVGVLYEHFHPRSVIDFGCSIGAYLRSFEKRGVKKILGIEGSIEVLKHAVINTKFILIHDLRKRLHLNEVYDMALCIEVAEHISPKYEKVFLDTICSAANILVFSSPTGGGGLHHVNEKPQWYWVREIGLRGFVLDKTLTIKVRKAIPNLKYLNPIKERLLVFIRRNRV